MLGKGGFSSAELPSDLGDKTTLLLQLFKIAASRLLCIIRG